MKRGRKITNVFCLFFVILLFFALSGCLNPEKEKASEIDELINSLPVTVTLEDEDAINAVKAAYDMLTDKQKEYITKYALLQTKLSELQGLKVDKENEAAALEVDLLIGELPDKITIAFKEQVEVIRNAYNELTDTQKTLVTKLTVLEAAEAEINYLIVNGVQTSLTETKEILDGLYKDLNFLTNNLNLTTYMANTGCNIIWSSSDQKVLTDEGIFDRPYTEGTVTLTAVIDYFGTITQVTYNFTALGYKDLSDGIASGYLYRSYSTIDDAFFDTLDLVYCAFALVDTKGNLNDNTTKACLETTKAYVIPRANTNGVWAVISIGGGGQSTQFSTVSASDELRKNFATNVVNMINKYNLDGVDIDWETPTAAEKTNFTLLMKEVYTQVKANNPNHLVTAAIAGGMWQPPRYDLENSIKYLDYVNMMTYGMVSNTRYYQNALYKSTSGKTLNSCSIAESVAIYYTYGIPSSKIIVGLAFYGMKQQYDTATSTWKSDGSIYYHSILDSYIDKGYTEYYDDECEVPYLLSDDGTIFVSYDNTRSVIAKCQYVLDNNLGGVMYWENGCDTSGTLVAAIKVGLKK